MNPYPLAPLNHFTTPCSFIHLLLRFSGLAHWGNLVLPVLPSSGQDPSAQGETSPETPRAADAPKLGRCGSSPSPLNWLCASLTPNFQCFGLPELANGVSPARRAHVMAGMYLKSKEKIVFGAQRNRWMCSTYGKMQAGPIALRESWERLKIFLRLKTIVLRLTIRESFSDRR